MKAVRMTVCRLQKGFESLKTNSKTIDKLNGIPGERLSHWDARKPLGPARRRRADRRSLPSPPCLESTRTSNEGCVYACTVLAVPQRPLRADRQSSISRKASSAKLVHPSCAPHESAERRVRLNSLYIYNMYAHDSSPLPACNLRAFVRLLPTCEPKSLRKKH